MKLVLENITHRLGKQNFSYNTSVEDSITGIFGLSGSGKTTLMHIISGLIKPKSGKIVFNNRVLFDSSDGTFVREQKRNIGVVFQDYKLFPHLTIKQNLNYSKPYLRKRFRGISSKKVIALLQLERLLDKKPAELSGGEQQRVAIGRALMSQPELLLMDEPFSNLDRQRRKQIISYLIQINQEFNIPMLVISHDLDDLLKLSSNLIVVDKGTVPKQGSYFEISQSGLVPHLIEPKHFVNTFELIHKKWDSEIDLNYFTSADATSDPLLITNSSIFSTALNQGKKVRFCIYPDDIALSIERLSSTSIQNQIYGEVTNIYEIGSSHYVSVFCGVPFVAELTKGSIKAMNLGVGSKVYCLIKAKAIEVLHIYA